MHGTGAGTGDAAVGRLWSDCVRPPDDLLPFVALFYLMRATSGRFAGTESADRAQLRFRLTPGTCAYRFAGGGTQDAPAAHVLGPTTEAFAMGGACPVAVFGMSLTPAGWAAMVGTDASLATDRVLDAEPLLGPDARAIAVTLAGLPGVADMAEHAGRMVRRWTVGRDASVSRFVAQVDDWLSAGSSPRLDALAERTGLSRRQVERRCNMLYGAPPKLLARRQRALSAAAALATGDADAPAEAFYDQSHMIREIKRFTGLTPCQIRGRRSPIARTGSARAPVTQVSPAASNP